MRHGTERNCEPMYKNRIEGAAEQGERAKKPRSFCGQGEVA